VTDTYHLDTWLWLPAPRSDVFAFFSDAHNLERITPPFLDVRVLTAAPIAVSRGTRIDYRLRLHGVPLRWTSEITQWEPPERFVDAQHRGPYAEWIHTHMFEERDGGTMVRDHVRYRLRGPLVVARLVNRLLVAPDTTAIFEFRQRALSDRFAAGGRARLGPVELRSLV